ncbi:hypothetical protein NPIL_347861 [Nephila pilipes]|uniref:Uncharacterized protein n=1 Tax=Nephila pilipes TaxID=299642 RepID=A0A8X6QTW0_NEPPI|nr:hypothetical protein NPIL_347861 [Nephila pilipes]
MYFIDFATAASLNEYRRHKEMSSAPKSDYLAFRIKIQEYFFHGSKEGDTLEYEPSQSPAPQNRKMYSKVPLPSDHLKKKRNLHLSEILNCHQKADEECLVANQTQKE